MLNKVSEPEVIPYASRRPRASTFKLPGLRWWMISLIMLGSVLNYLTRNTLSVAQVRLQDELHITEQQYSWITGAFQGAIMLQPICGYVLDVIGLRIGVAIFVVAWSVINMAHGLAGSWRGGGALARPLGVGERGGHPPR